MRIKISEKFWYGVMILAIISTLVIPVLIANEIVDMNPFTILFELMFLTALCAIVIESAYMSAARIYGFSKSSMWAFENEPEASSENERNQQRLHSLYSCFFSYFMMLYGYGVSYYLVYKSDPSSFKITISFKLIDAMYFSVVTAATVGYGDYTPVSTSAKLLVMAETLTSLMYVVFLFSILNETLRLRKTNLSANQEDTPD